MHLAVGMPSPAELMVAVQPSLSHQLLSCCASADSGSTLSVLRDTVDTETPAPIAQVQRAPPIESWTREAIVCWLASPH